MRCLITVILCSLLVGCSRHAVVDQAKADFKARHPQWQITKVYLGDGDADHAYVYIRYLHTSASQLPQKTTIMEMELGYRKEGSGWSLFKEAGSRAIRAVR